MDSTLVSSRPLRVEHADIAIQFPTADSIQTMTSLYNDESIESYDPVCIRHLDRSEAAVRHSAHTGKVVFAKLIYHCSFNIRIIMYPFSSDQIGSFIPPAIPSID